MVGESLEEKMKVFFEEFEKESEKTDEIAALIKLKEDGVIEGAKVNSDGFIAVKIDGAWIGTGIQLVNYYPHEDGYHEERIA